MKIVHVVAGLDRSSGIAAVVGQFADAGSAAGHEVTVATTFTSSVVETPIAGRVAFKRSRLPILGRLCFSWQMLTGLLDVCRGADIVHVHGSWTFPVWWGARCGRKSGAKVVLSPHGSFDPVRLCHGRWRKMLVGPLDRMAARLATVVHATSFPEEEWIRKFIPGIERVVVIPPGVECDEPPSLTAAHHPLRILYLGRRHPLKGLDLLAEAVEGLDVELKIADRAFGAEREELFRWCDVLVLPTRSENFGLVVAEALVRSRPVVVTRAAPWEGVVEHRCGWWTDVSSAALREAITEAITAPLAEMGKRGREWMLAEYDPKVLSAKLLEAVGT